MEVQRAVGVEGEGHPARHGEAVQCVGHLEAVLVVERDRPEGIDRRDLVLLEVQDVVALAIQRLAGGVSEVQRIDRVLRQVGAEALLRDDGALQVVIAINTHGVGVH